MEPQTGTSVFVLIRGTLLQGLKVTKSNGCTYWTSTSRWGFFLFFYSRNKLGSFPSPGAPPSDRGPSVSELCVVLFYFPFQNHTDFDSAVQLDEGRGHLTWCSISFYWRFLTAARPRPVSELHKRRKQGRPECESFKTSLPGLFLPPDGLAKLTQQIQETLHMCLWGSVVFPVWQFILF